VTLATLFEIFIIYFIKPGPAFAGVPRSVLLVDYILTIGLLEGCGSRRELFLN